MRQTRPPVAGRRSKTRRPAPDIMPSFAITCDDCSHHWGPLHSDDDVLDSLLDSGAEIAGINCPECGSPRFHAVRIQHRH